MCTWSARLGLVGKHDALSWLTHAKNTVITSNLAQALLP
jgi:hypothetical protein